MADHLPDPLSRPCRAEDVHTYPLGDEVLLYVSERQIACALNATSWAVWDMCDGSRTLEDIGRELAALVGRPPVDILPDVLDAAARLEAAGLFAPDA